MIPPDIALAFAPIPGGKYPHACLTVNEGLLSLQATDGYIFLEVTWEDDTLFDLEARLGFSRTGLEAIGQGQQVQGVPEEHFSFPAFKDMGKIWVKNKKLHHEDWGISAHKMLKILNAMVDLGIEDGEAIRLSMDDAISPLNIDKVNVHGSFSVRAAVAPMKLDA